MTAGRRRDVLGASGSRSHRFASNREVEIESSQEDQKADLDLILRKYPASSHGQARDGTDVHSVVPRKCVRGALVFLRGGPSDSYHLSVMTIKRGAGRFCAAATANQVDERSSASG